MRREEVVLAGDLRGPRHVRGPDDRWRDGPGAILVPPRDVRRLAILSSAIIPPQYFVATAERETGFCSNEVDTERIDQPDEIETHGLFQVDRGEAADVGEPGADLYDPVICLRVFARLQEGRLIQIRAAAGGGRLPDDWAYLGLGHNEGIAAALKTIRRYGEDWAEYKRRNANAARLAIQTAETPEEQAKARAGLERVRRISAYGEAMISGGDRWAEAVAV